MADLHLFVRRLYLLPRLLSGPTKEFRPSFQILRSPTVLNDFASRGHFAGFVGRDGLELKPDLKQAPFIPFLGAMHLSRRSLPVHTLIHAERDGWVRDWPPFSSEPPPSQKSQGVWPVPLVVESRSPAAVSSVPNDLPIKSALRLHIYPVGLVSVLLSLTVRGGATLSPSELIPMIQRHADIKGTKSKATNYCIAG